VLVPVPVCVKLPGVEVRTQVPDAGNPFNTTLPVLVTQSGWVIEPMPGTEGVNG
jgi:hypothetical protein